MWVLSGAAEATPRTTGVQTGAQHCAETCLVQKSFLQLLGEEGDGFC